MTVTTLFAATSDGGITSTDSNSYAQALAGTGDNLTADTTSTVHAVGQIKSGATFQITQMFLNVDVSSITATDNVDAAALSLVLAADDSATDFTVEVRLLDWGDTLTTADWQTDTELSALTLLASISTSGIGATNEYKAFTSEAAMATAIETALAGDGVLRMIVVSSRNTSGTEPSGNERVTWRSADNADTSLDPKLVVTHSPATQTVNAATIASGSQLFAATLTVGEAMVNAAFIASGSQTFTATLVADQTVSAAFIASGSELFTGDVGIDQTLSAAFIASGSQLFAGRVGQPILVSPRRKRNPEFFVAVYGPLPKTGSDAPHEVPITGRTTLSWSSGLPGGWLAAQVGIPDESTRRSVGYRNAVQFMLPTALEVPAKGHVEIWESGTGLVFEGRLEGGERVGTRLRGLDIDGYGVATTQDRQFLGGNATDKTTAGRILRSILGTSLSGLSIGEIEDTGVFHTYSEFARMTPMQALSMLAQEGGGAAGDRYTWHVYHRTLNFVSTAITGEPDYQIPLDERVIVREDYRAIKSHMRMFYQDAVSGEEVLSAVFSNDLTAENFIESHQLVEGGQVSAGGASQSLITALANASKPQYSITITRGPGEGLEGVGGDTPAYRVLAGQSVGIEGLGSFLIAGARHSRDDAGGISTQIDIGQPVTRSEAGVMERLLRAAAALATGRDPNTLARAR